MRIQQQDLDYLSGKSYSNGREIKFAFDRIDDHYFSRTEFLRDIACEKNIIHVGFVDHDIDSIQKKINKNKWLHSVLDQVATRCFGVDILEDEVDFVRHSLGFDDVGVADITAAIPQQAKGTDWDYVMIPEVLEHIDNPVAFLSGIKKVWTGHAKKIVITVPNAFTPSNYRFARRKVEKINTDHRFWFTPYTLAKVVMQAGLQVDSIVMCHHGRVKKRAFFRNLWFKRNPLLRSDIVMLVDFE